MKSPLSTCFVVVVAAVVWLVLCISEPTTVGVSALGGNNIFGIFRKRRTKLQDVQDKREQVAARRGWSFFNSTDVTTDSTDTDASWRQRVSGWLDRG